MNHKNTEVTFLTSNKSGILSFIMVKARKLGLVYQKNQTVMLDDDCSRLSILFFGELNCSTRDLINAMEASPQIHCVEKITVEGLVVEPSKNTTTLNAAPQSINDNFLSVRAQSSTDVKPLPIAHTGKIKAHDTITPESIQVAEEALVNYLGPIASLLVRSAATQTKHIGDLYLMLSEELDEEDRSKFLNLVSGLNLGQF